MGVFEIEKKAYLKNRDVVHQKVLAMGAVFEDSISVKSDIYLSNSEIKSYQTLDKEKKIFRIRKIAGQYYLTLKFRVLVNNTEVNEELEVLVHPDNGKDLYFFLEQVGVSADESILSNLYILNSDQDWIHFFQQKGFILIARKEKHSQVAHFVYQGYQVNIEFNTITGLGDFLEVEVISSDTDNKELIISIIDSLFQELNIPKELEERRLYIDLLTNKE